MAQVRRIPVTLPKLPPSQARTLANMAAIEVLRGHADMMALGEDAVGLAEEALIGEDPRMAAASFKACSRIRSEVAACLADALGDAPEPEGEDAARRKKAVVDFGAAGLVLLEVLDDIMQGLMEPWREDRERYAEMAATLLTGTLEGWDDGHERTVQATAAYIRAVVLQGLVDALDVDGEGEE